jgi:EAL domain-containing protein (putative c-di-GMP-specific phosphodiesterase class I)
VQAILSLARAFKMKTVAEGVESAPVAALLENAGCEMAQGFYFSQPLTADGLIEILEAANDKRGLAKTAFAP